MQLKSFLTALCLAVLMIFLTTACLQNDLKTLTPDSLEGGAGNNGGDDGGSCKTSFINKTQAEPYTSVYESADSKVVRSDYGSQIETVKVFGQDVLIKKGTQLIYKIDTECLKKSSHTNLSNKFSNQVKSITQMGISKEDYFVETLSQDLLLSDLESQVDQDECVVGVAPNTKIELQAVPDDALYSLQNNMKLIQHDKYYSKILSQITNEVVVAVVDSGSDQQNPDMDGRHWRNQVELSGQTGVDDDGNGFVDDIYGYSWACYIGGDKPFYAWWMPHGEHVAGIIAATTDNNIGVSGVAGQVAKIMNLNVIYSGNPAFPCNGTEQDLVLAIRAIRYAADNGARVINLSMGTFGRNSMMEDVMRYAVSKGVYVASAAGNNDRFIQDNETDFFYPCGYAKDIDGYSCVGAVDSSPANRDVRCIFSNYSTDYVELSAPGCDDSVPSQVGYSYGQYGVLSTVRKTEDPMYKYMPGTSMATPHIAGAAAVVVGYMKSKTGIWPTPAQVEEILKNGSRKALNLSTYVTDGRTLDLESLFLYMDSLVGPGC